MPTANFCRIITLTLQKIFRSDREERTKGLQAIPMKIFIPVNSSVMGLNFQFNPANPDEYGINIAFAGLWDVFFGPILQL